MFVDFTGFGILFPVLPFLSTSLGASPQEVTLVIAAGAACQVIAAPLWGRASDRLGRRPILIATLFGGAIAYFTFAIASSLAMVFLSRALTGAMGAIVPVTQAWMADVTEPRQRAAAMGRISAATGLGFVIGPALGGILSELQPGHPDYAVPCLLAGGLAALAGFLAVFFLPEPVRRASQRSAPRAPAATRRAFLPLLVMVFAVTFAFSGVLSIFPLWLRARFDYGALEVGYGFAMIGIASTVCQLWLVAPLVRKFGERRVLLVASVVYAGGLALTPLSDTLPPLLATALIVTFAVALCQTTLLTLISRRADASTQGAALGAAGSAQSAARVFGPTSSGFTFSAIHQDAPFESGAAVALGIAATSFLLARSERR